MIMYVAEVLEELTKSCNLYIVTGGGETARECIKIARDLSAMCIPNPFPIIKKLQKLRRKVRKRK